MPLPKIKPGEHVLVAGQTGSGKTVLLQELIRKSEVAPVFIIDSKGDNGFLTLARPDETLIIYGNSPGENCEHFFSWIQQPSRKIPEYVVIRPPFDEVTEPGILDLYVLNIYKYFKGPCIVVVDELYMLHKSGRCGPGVSAMLTRGRSQGKSLYGATQRPAWISGFCLSEATYYFIFRLLDINDRKRLTHIGFETKTLLDKFHYYEYSSNEGGVYQPPLELTFQSGETGNFNNSSRWL